MNVECSNINLITSFKCTCKAVHFYKTDWLNIDRIHHEFYTSRCSEHTITGPKWTKVTEEEFVMNEIHAT